MRLIEPANETEQQLAAGLGEWQIAEFVEDDEVETREIIGDRRVLEPQRLRSRYDRRRFGITLTHNNLEDDVGRMDAVLERLGAGGLDRRQAVGEHGGENGHHLAIAIVGAGKLAAHALEPLRQSPVFKRRAVPRRPWLSSQDRHVMPKVSATIRCFSSFFQ